MHLTDFSERLSEPCWLKRVSKNVENWGPDFNATIVKCVCANIPTGEQTTPWMSADPALPAF